MAQPSARRAGTDLCRPPVVVFLDLQPHAERTGQVLVRQRLAQRARRDDLPAAQEQQVGDAGGDLLDVMGDHDRRRVPVGSSASAVSVSSSASRPARSSPAPGSSSSSSSGSVMSARAICTRLRSPSLSVPNVRSAMLSTCSSDMRSAARSKSWSSYRSCQRPTTPYDALTTRSDTFSEYGTCSASAEDASPIRVAGRTRPPRPASRPGSRRSRPSGASGSTAPSAAWSSRRRWGR
jgi:hypothetical protein